jgi:hypothetical protein
MYSNYKSDRPFAAWTAVLGSTERGYPFYLAATPLPSPLCVQASLVGELITGEGILHQLGYETGIPLNEIDPLVGFFLLFNVLIAIGVSGAANGPPLLFLVSLSGLLCYQTHTSSVLLFLQKCFRSQEVKLLSADLLYCMLCCSDLSAPRFLPTFAQSNSR